MAKREIGTEEFISDDTHWILRTGNLMFLVIIVLFLACSFFIRYPDVIRGSMKLLSRNAPKLVVAPTDGKLVKLFVTNEMEVMDGQVLAYLQSTGRHEQVLALEKWILCIEPYIIRDSFGVLSTHPLPVYNALGELQPAYQAFQNVFKETEALLPLGYYEQRKNALVRELDFIDATQRNRQEQDSLLHEDYKLQKTEYDVNEILSREKVIDLMELNRNKSKAIGKEEVLRQMDAQLIAGSVDRHNKEREIAEFLKFKADQRQKFKSELFNLKSRVGEWKRQYVLVAPEKGKVLFISLPEENQFLEKGEELFFIQPAQSLYYGQLSVAQTGLGKIKSGQPVVIRVESYPSDEFGYLRGTVGYISSIPTGRDSFLIRVDLTGGLNTNMGAHIVFKNSLRAQAEVITDDRKLADRLLGQLADKIRF